MWRSVTTSMLCFSPLGCHHHGHKCFLARLHQLQGSAVDGTVLHESAVPAVRCLTCRLCACRFCHSVFAPCRSSQWFWEHELLLKTIDALKPLQRFYLAMVADNTIPMRGDVDLMTGGPPCQVCCLSEVTSECHV